MKNKDLAACLARGGDNPGFREVAGRYMTLDPDGIVRGCALAGALVGMAGDARLAFDAYQQRLSYLGSDTPPPEVFAHLLDLPHSWAYYLCMRHDPDRCRSIADISQMIERGTFFKDVPARSRP